MTRYLKGGVALLLALLPLFCLVFNHSFPKPDLTPQPLYVAKDQSQTTLASALGLWKTQNYSEAYKVLSSVNPFDQPQVDLYQFYMDDYLSRQQKPNWSQKVGFTEHCKQNILFVTSQLTSLAQAKKFKERFAQDNRFDDLPICVHSTTFFAPKSLSCRKNWQQKGRLGCDLLPLAEQLKKLDFTHIVIFADAGKANVHNGIMFLDKQDTYDVFVHELAHFSGFIDEYPLSAGLAKRVCAGVDAPNLIFKKVDETINVDSLSLARTCDNHSTQAYKVSSGFTFMEYHDIAFIPPDYIEAWQTLLVNPPRHPSAHLNFAQLYEEANNQTESQYWRTQYQHYLSGI